MKRGATDKTASAGRRRKTPARPNPCRACPALAWPCESGCPAREDVSEAPRPRRSKVVAAPSQHPRHNYHPGVLALIVCLFVILLLAGTISARYGNAPAPGAISRGTVPPSSYRSALVNAPDPVDNTGSLAITGNAAGGKSFRGHIPYGSTTSFSGRLGSTSLDPFLRNSTGPEESSRGPALAGSFYSPTGSVPKLEPASTGVFAPGSPRIAAGVMQTPADQAVNTMLAPEFAPSRTWTGRSPAGGASTAATWLSPSARTPEQMRWIVAGESDGSRPDRGPLKQTKQLMTSQEYQRQLEQLQGDLDRVRSRASDFERDLNVGRQPSVAEAWAQRRAELPLPPVSAEDIRRIIQPELPAQPWSATTNPSAGQDLSLVPAGSTPDRPAASGLGDLTLVPPGRSPAGSPTGALSPSRPEPYGPSSTPMPSPSELAAQLKRIDAIFAPQTNTTPAPTSNESSNELPALPRVEAVARAFDAPGRIKEQPLQTAAGNVPAPTPAHEVVAPPEADLPPAPQSPAPPGKVQPSPADRSAAPPAPLGPDAQGKFDACLKSAQADMRQGQYVRAAESFALASVYNPRDAQSQLGRSHALLAAGEYLGSAVCLAKAIELDPRVSLAELDLVETIGGPDRFLQRITDLQERAKSSNAPGLQLLLAYIYQQMKRPEEARTAIEAAKKALPSSPAVDLLERAIAGASPG